MRNNNFKTIGQACSRHLKDARPDDHNFDAPVNGQGPRNSAAQRGMGSPEVWLRVGEICGFAVCDSRLDCKIAACATAKLQATCRRGKACGQTHWAVAPWYLMPMQNTNSKQACDNPKLAVHELASFLLFLSLTSVSSSLRFFIFPERLNSSDISILVNLFSYPFVPDSTIKHPLSLF